MVSGSYQKDSRTEATVARFELNMVQLSLSPTLDVTPPPECSEEGEERQENPVMAGSPKVDSPDELDALQLNLVVSTTYHGYETYIEDGLICLKHKVRNLEKKKLKLEDYKKRLELGKALNKDQMAAVEKYEQVVHNLGFAQELHKTLDDLTQNLLRAQKKAVKREQVAKEEVEKRQLSTVLQVHYLLLSMQHEHVQRDLLAGHNQAPQIPAQKLDNLNQLAVLLGVKRDNNLSLEEQMEQAALVYLDLLEGKDKPVVGSTFKMFKDELDGLLHCKYFTCLPTAPSKSPEMLKKSSRHMPDSKSEPTCISKENWKEFQAMKEPDLADCWDMALLDGHTSLKNALHKPWRGAATFIPKLPVTTRDSAGSKQRKARKAKGDRSGKLSHQVEMPVEIFNSPPTLPKDPILRKQHFEDFMAKIHSSFSFMQDSLLEGESSPTSGSRHKMQQSGSHSSLDDFEQLDRFVQSDLRNSSEILPKIIHSTPLLSGHLESKTCLPTGDQCLDTYELEISSKDLTNKHLQLVERKKFSSPPQYCKDPTTTINLDKSCPHTPVSESGKTCPSNGLATCNSSPSQTFSTPPTRRTLTSAQFQNIQSVFKASPSQSSNEDVNYKPDSGVFADSRYSSASTQTPPEFAPSEEEQLSAGNSGQIFLSPGQAGGNMGRPNQSYYSRGSVRGMARGGRGLAQAFRTSGWHRGGAYIHHGHPRDCGPVLNASRDSEHSYRRWGGWLNSNADWNDSTQVSSPGLMGTFTCVDSGHAEALSITMEIPLTPNGHHAAFLPMQLYPLFQPLRVAFSASRTANFAPGNLDQPIVFDHLHSNLGEMYDTHIGRFTCPANGMYVFMFHILKLAINIPLYINLMRNEEVMVSAYANDGAPDHETASNHTILHLFQGDQVWLRLHRGAIYGSTWNYSTFSGFLLHQD